MDTTLDTPNPSKRKRARIACTPCRQRKRKCDGFEPCRTCTSWGYACYYDEPRRRSRKVRDHSPDAQPSPPHSTSHPNTVEVSEKAVADRDGLVRRLEANSGALFVRKLGLKINPAKAPKLNLFSWNIGNRQLTPPVTSTTLALPIVQITALESMKALAQVYFDKVHPCYGFIDQTLFFERLELRWRSPIAWELYDSTLAGVAALGCLFSLRDASITELRLVRTACAVLDMQHLSGPPSIDLLTGWTLRSIYLRMTDSPHSTWVASSTLMHLVEAAGLHPDSHSVLPERIQCDVEIQKRLVGVAHHLNVWTSYDLGLSRVSFQKDDLPALPSERPGDCTVELLRLLPVSVSLDPSRSKDETDLTSTLSSLLDGIHTQPPSIMAQCNLVLCVLRRIHTQNLDIPSELAAKVLGLLKKGLDCARGMVTDCSPWHQVANVPFQIICVLLVMDTRSSLAMLPEAMQTLGLVASIYDTETMREAQSAACLLVMLHQQRRKDDVTVLGEALQVHQQGRPRESPPQLDPNSEEYSWLGALVADLPGLQRVDLDQFLNADMIDTSVFSGLG